MAAHFGRNLRRGAATTAVAAVAVAALSASQAPGFTTDAQRHTTEDAPVVPDGDGATGDSPYFTDLPPLNSPTPAPSSTGGPQVGVGPIESGIPATVLDAYKKAEAELRLSKPGCNLPWQLLAAIGKVESGQARGGHVDSAGNTLGKILGPQLNGRGFAKIADSDGGQYDGDAAYDRAVGPMQFIPTTWSWAGRDGNGDGVKDPNNVYDAALAAGHYLCRAGRDLSRDSDLHAAILSYNGSQEYLATVLSWLSYYRRGTIHAIPDGTGPLPSHRSDGGTVTVPVSPHPTPSATTLPAKNPSPESGSPSTSPSPGAPGTASPSPSPNAPGNPGTSDPSAGNGSQTPTESVVGLKDAATGGLTAMAGHAFGERISTRAETTSGGGVGGVRVRFTITGDTDATFAGGESVATVLTNSSGIAVAPALEAGEKTGDFTVHAGLIGRDVTGVDYTATVTARAADVLARVGDTALVCTSGGEFAEQITLKATYLGAAADKVAATATLVTSPIDSTEIDKGPYFKDADGNPVRTLALTTDADGLLKLPTLYAGDITGTFLLRVTTTGGATVTVPLTVSEPTPTSTPSESAGTSEETGASAQ